MPKSLGFRRKATDLLATLFTLVCALLVLAPLAAIFGYLLYRGAGAVDWAFFTQIPKPPGEVGGGMANAIAGTAFILGMGSLLGVPVGVACGIYLSEYAHSRIGAIVRFTADVLNGVPSIVIGIAVYTLIVLRQKHFSAFAGALALGIMMIPTISRTTEEVLRMVPSALREAALGLGVPQWRVAMSVVLPTARSGVITGIMLAFARVAGETAPLLFTAFGNAFWNMDPRQPTAALPLQVFAYAISPYDDWHRKAWAGALVLVTLIVASVSLVRWATSRNQWKGSY